MATEPHSWGAHDDLSLALHQATSVHSRHSVARDDNDEHNNNDSHEANANASPYELNTLARPSSHPSRQSRTRQSSLHAPSLHDANTPSLSPSPSPSQQDLSKDDPYSRLPEHEAATLRRQIDVAVVKIKYKDLFRYADRADLAIIAISAVCAIAAGVALPAMTIIFGSLTGTFRGYFTGDTTTPEFHHTVSEMALDLVYIGIGEFVATYVFTVGFIYTGEHIAGKIRKEYLSSVLRQNIGYFDKLGSGEITTRITADTNTIQDGVSEKLGLILQALATFVGAYVIGLIKFWKLALILMSSVVATLGTAIFLTRFLMKYARLSIASYAAGGNIVEEAISSIRNAVAFGTQEIFADRYDTHLAKAENAGFRAKFVQSSVISTLMLYIYLTYSLGFWLASKYITDGEASLSQCVTVLLSIMIGSFSLGNVAPSFQALTASVAAATKVFATIDRQSPLDPTDDKGDTLSDLHGEVELRDIKHIYPSRPEVIVAEGLNLIVPAGKTTALVGTSGSGKSTIVGLVERFYDPVGGQVLLDGVDLKKLNLRWLRQQISLVSQEPTLFATTIKENIRFGLIGTHHNLTAEKESEMIESAAKMSNAHDFISALPNGYETHVGERGFLLSGGQKQRIAIARAIVSNPRILLLDEATSALDTKSEGVVQAALDKASEGRTTIVIAHRLSTIKNADNIVVMSAGKIVEQGKHEDLLRQEGVYHGLVEAQRINAEVAQKQLASDEVEDKESDDYLSSSRLSGPIKDSDLDEDDPSELGRTKSLGALSTKSKAPSNIAALKDTSDGRRYSLWTLIKTILSFNKPEWPQMTLGAFAAVIAGSGQPVQSVFFAKSISNLARPPPQYPDVRSQQDFWSWMYFMLAFVLLIVYQVQGTIFAWCSEKMIRRARFLNFRYILRQDIGFFDREENSAGALTSFLSTETASLAGISGSTLGTILQVSATLIVGFVISIAIAWKFALVCIATIPLLLAAGFLRFWMLSRYQARAKQAYEKSAAYACEATSAIRTVASLTREADVWETYNGMITAQEAASLRSILQSSSLYATAQSMLFFCIALAFWWGSQLIVDKYLDLFQYYVCYQACLFGAQSAGIIFSFAPEMGKAQNAARTMKRLFDRQPEIDFWATNEGQMMETVRGEVKFQNVHFRYPTRPGQPVLRGLDLQILPGQYVALVGASGCGKSTTISLLERFYNPTSGDILIDSQPISSINVNALRKHIALVSQEPTLYQGTIRENILLGCSSDMDPEKVPQERIVEACKDANIHEFIMSLPDQFETVVGHKGGMLSGGQKQRIAIARALLRDPRILLLDEATSALDSESEKVVQAALDRAAQGRTTIAVAHRLSTIQKADKIFVFDGGKVVESGTHTELVRLKGRYYELVNLQTLGGT